MDADQRVVAPAGTTAPPGQPWLRDAAEVAAGMEVDQEVGLSPAEAARRLATDGPNELRGTPPVPAWRRFLRQFQDPLIYLLFAAIAIATVAWLLEGAVGLPVDAVVIAAIVVLNAVIGFVQENRASDAVAALAEMTAATSTVLRGGELVSVPSSELVQGDILVLAEGDSVGADGRLLRASALRIQEASLTGESEASAKDAEPLEEAAELGDRRNMVYKGTAVAQGTGRAVVTATGMTTEMGAIADLLDRTQEEDSPLTVQIARVSRLLGVIVIVIAVVVMAALALLNGVSGADDAIHILLLGVSLAVAAVPEGLPAILTIVLALGVQRLARRNAVVKELHAVETLGSASVICSDKTGTLTKNEMTIEQIRTASGTAEVSGVGYIPDGAVTAAGSTDEDALRTEVLMLLTAGSRANDAQLSERDGAWQIQGDPTEAAFLVAARKLAGVDERVGRYQRAGEVPFTSERKMMSTLDVRDDGSRVLMAKGAPDVLLERCTHLQVGSQARPIGEADRAAALADVAALSSQAFRTLGVAYRLVEEDPPDELDDSVEQGLVYLGVVGIIDPPRDEARAAVADARRAGIRTVMITGDHPLTAARIAADLGIARPGEEAVTGAQLSGTGDEDLIGLAETTNVYARVAPEHKLRIVDALQARGQIVAMTGDGVNDAPALKTADIGVAMGITGTEVTKQASRMILADDNFATIVAAVRQGRVIFDNIQKFLRFLLSSNMGEVATVFFGVVLAGVIGLDQGGGELVVPLLATQILWINLVTDTAPALAMGIDPEIDDVMARPPRPMAERVIDTRMWGTILLTGAVMGAVTLFTLDLFLPGGLVAGSDSLEVARTAAFTTLVLAQLFNAFNARSETTTAFARVFSNPWLWAAVGLTAVLQVLVVSVPFLQTAFGTAALAPVHWLACLALASVVLWVEEVRKLVLRSRDARA